MTFSKRNYILMAAGLVLIVVGFILLSGGGAENPTTEFSYDLFSFRRLWLAPIAILGGLVLEGVAIMHRGR